MLPNPTQLTAGDVDSAHVLARRFHLRALLGRGGMGEVFRAWDSHLASEVALKRIREPSPTARRQLRREFRMLAGLRHPNLVQLHDLVDDGDTLLFTMELVTGRPLGFRDLSSDRWRDQAFDEDIAHATTVECLDEQDAPEPPTRVRSAPPAAWETVREAFAQLASALTYLHRAGVMHLDLKPGNVLREPGGRVVVVDFGLADWRTADLAAGQTRRLAGTPAYMAPERLRSGSTTAACDVYAMGVMLAEALAGRAPVTVRPFTEADLPRHAPEDLRRLATAMLQPAPERRPAALDVLRSLTAQRGERSPRMSQLPRRDVFVGRQPELRWFDEALSRADARSEPAALSLTGGSGMGKTTLVGEWTRDQQVLGRAYVLRGTCAANEHVPWGAFGGLMDALAAVLDDPALPAPAEDPGDTAAVAALFPALAPRHQGAPGANPRARAFSAVAARLRAVSEARPVVLWVDDAQWLRDDAAGALSAVMQQVVRCPVLLVLSARPEGPRALALLDALRAHRVAVYERGLGRLSTRAALAMLGMRQRHGDADASFVLDQTDGIPFVIRHMVEICRARTTQGVARALRGGQTLEALLVDHMSALPAEALAVLRLIATAYEPVPIQALAGLPWANLAVGLATLRTQRLVRRVRGRSGASVEPAHARLAGAVAEQITAAELPALHQSLGRLFAALPGTSVSAARHLERAGAVDDARAHWFKAAAEAEATYAFAAAASCWERAGALEPDPAERRALARRQAGALEAAGDAHTAAKRYEALADDEADDEAEAHARSRAVCLWLSLGELELASTQLRPLCARFGWPVQPGGRLSWSYAARARLAADLSHRPASAPEPLLTAKVDLARQVAVMYGTVEFPVGATFQPVHLRDAQRLGDPGRLARALATEVLMAGTSGPPGRRLRVMLGRLEALRPALEDPQDEAWIDLATGYLAFLRGRFKRALRELSAAIARYDASGRASWERDFARAQRVFVLRFLGRWDDMRAACHQLTRELSERSSRLQLSYVQAGAGHLVTLLEGGAGLAWEQLRASRDDWGDRLPMTLRYLYGSAELDLLLYEGRNADAVARVRALRKEVRPMLLHSVVSSNLVLLEAQGLLGLGGDGAVRRATRAARRLQRQPASFAWPLAPLLRAQALLLADAPSAAAEAAIETAIERLTARGLGRHALAAEALLRQVRGEPVAGRDPADAHTTGLLRLCGAALLREEGHG